MTPRAMTRDASIISSSRKSPSAAIGAKISTRETRMSTVVY
jgi:hypothetical protein